MSMKKDDCIFCKIANGEIPSRTIYEDSMFRAILDVSPATQGHTLLLPKEHFQDVFALDEEYTSKIMGVAQLVGKKLQQGLACDGMNLVQNNGVLAGQTVFHYHLHLIPRYEGDGQQINWVPKEVSGEELGEVEKLISI